MAHKSMIQTKRQEDKVAKNASNRGDNWKVTTMKARANTKNCIMSLEHTLLGQFNKKAMSLAGYLYLCGNRCKIFIHNGLCTVNAENCNKELFGSSIQDPTIGISKRSGTGSTSGKQHKASCKSKIQNSISQPLFMMYMDLFGPTFVSSLTHKKYGLVVTDDYSRFTWVFFLASKDETAGILKKFITEIENLVDKKVKIIRCDNGTKFKNSVMNDFCAMKCIKREFSIARTPQQNDVAERRNKTLIEAIRTMLANSKLPTTF
ncbi:putative ribonuclease H-like domain-containing protein [Tanacetum coccineum]